MRWYALATVVAVFHAIDARAQTTAGGNAAAPRTLRAVVADVAAVSPAAVVRQPVSGTLTLKDAIQRGIEYNLAAMGLTADVERTRADRGVARSAFLPNLSGDASIMSQRVNLAAMGVAFDEPDFTVPGVVGPFKVLDARVRLTQAVYDRAALDTVRAAEGTMRAAALATDDARNRIVLMVGSAYLEAVAARSRLQLAQAQVATAVAVRQKAEQQQAAGLGTPLDLSRARVDELTAQQHLLSLEAEVAKAKIELARMIGMPPGAEYDVASDLPYAPPPPMTLEAAVAQALARPDIAAAAEQLAAAERSRDAARGGRLPSVLVVADVGASQAMSEPARATYMVAGVVRVPIWQGGRAGARVEQASAAVAQRRAEVDDLKARAESEVRRVYVDLRTADGRVGVARESLTLTRETLAYVQRRHDNGLTEDVELARARESVAAAELEYTGSVLAHNAAKLALARAIGRASGDLAPFLLMP
jgi:outer membrane protein TolC